MKLRGNHKETNSGLNFSWFQMIQRILNVFRKPLPLSEFINVADLGGGSVITIDRQKALNAINLDMYRYEKWESSVNMNWLNAQKTLTLKSLNHHRHPFIKNCSCQFNSWRIVIFIEVNELNWHHWGVGMVWMGRWGVIGGRKRGRGKVGRTDQTSEKSEYLLLVCGLSVGSPALCNLHVWDASISSLGRVIERGIKR